MDMPVLPDPTAVVCADDQLPSKVSLSGVYVMLPLSDPIIAIVANPIWAMSQVIVGLAVVELLVNLLIKWKARLPVVPGATSQNNQHLAVTLADV
jgi:hypothetical protein